MIAVYGLHVETRNLSEKSEMASFEIGKGLDRLQSKFDKVITMHGDNITDVEVLKYISNKCEQTLLKLSDESSDSVHLSYLEQYGRSGRGGLHYITNELNEISAITNNIYADSLREWRLDDNYSPKIARMFPPAEQIEGYDITLDRKVVARAI